jgi:hypothetical protein
VSLSGFRYVHYTLTLGVLQLGGKLVKSNLIRAQGNEYKEDHHLYHLGRERRVNLLVGLARIFVYYIRYINVCADFC